jgi:dCTP diphosphatase
MTDETTPIAELRTLVRQFVAERQWQGYHDPKNLSMSIAIEAAELMEHFQWVRSEELPALLADAAKREQIADEIADIQCYLLALANVLDLDLSTALTGKMCKNRAKYPAEQFRGRYYKPEGA